MAQVSTCTAPNADHGAEDEQDGQAPFGTHEAHHSDRDRQEKHSDGNGAFFVPAAGDPVPKREGDQCSDEQQAEDQVVIFFEVHVVLEEIQQGGLGDVQRDQPEQENACGVKE
jgi:hypothetical protein